MNCPPLSIPGNPAELSTDFAGRLVTLCDGRTGLRTGMPVEMVATSAGGASTLPTIDFIASSEALDRYDEILSASGWRLENYRRNPVFQNAHQYGDIIFTLGKALITEVRSGASGPCLFQRIEFAVEANPMARIAYGLYKGKFLNAVSVGFIPLRWQDGEAAERGSSPAGGRCRRKYLEQELLEVSAVGIPANPEALQLGLKTGAIPRSDLVELSGLLEQICHNFRSDTAVSDPHASAPGIGGNGAQLLHLARALGELLRRS